MTGGGPLLFEISGQSYRVGAKSPIFDLFLLVASQPDDLAKKSSINTNRKSTTRFLMNPRWTSYVVPKPPKGGSKTQSVQNLNFSCDNSETARDRMSVMSLIGSRIRAFD